MDYRLKSLRQKIGFIPQKALLFNWDSLETISVIRQSMPVMRTYASKDVAQAKDFIEGSREEGFITHLAGGSNLSGGQKQRLSILHEQSSRVNSYIFDDSFSALDYHCRCYFAPSSGSDWMLRWWLLRNVLELLWMRTRLSSLIRGEIVGRGRHENWWNQLAYDIAFAVKNASDRRMRMKQQSSLARLWSYLKTYRFSVSLRSSWK